jgi:DNA-binding MarR family transcriptional regulator
MTTPPAVYGEFGTALAFAERTLSAVLHQHLAQRGTSPGTWYAFKLIATRGPGIAREALIRDLEGSRDLGGGTAHDVLARLEAEGMISGDARVDLTPAGEAEFRSLREYVTAPTIRLLSEFDIADIETTVRTVQAITRRAAQDSPPLAE